MRVMSLGGGLVMWGREPVTDERASVPPAGDSVAPAFYAVGPVAGGWWLLLHPPYTAWHLSYIVVGPCLPGPGT